MRDETKEEGRGRRVHRRGERRTRRDMKEKEEAREVRAGAMRAEKRKGKRMEKEKWERCRGRQGRFASIRYTSHCISRNVFQTLNDAKAEKH